MGLASDIAHARSEGFSIFRSIDLDESEEQVKAGAGIVMWARIHNLASALRCVKFYDGLAADVVVGTDTPVLTIPMAAGAGETWAVPLGFETGITVAAVTGVLDNSTGAPGANEVVINLAYA